MLLRGPKSSLKSPGFGEQVNSDNTGKLTEVGGELANDLDSYEKVMPTNARIFIGDNEIFPTAYNINGNNYFKLRDIAKELDFGVDWKNWTVVIDTTTGYMDE